MKFIKKRLVVRHLQTSEEVFTMSVCHDLLSYRFRRKLMNIPTGIY